MKFVIIESSKLCSFKRQVTKKLFLSYSYLYIFMYLYFDVELRHLRYDCSDVINVCVQHVDGRM